MPPCLLDERSAGGCGVTAVLEPSYREGLRSGKPDMRIRRDLVVLSHDGTLKNAGRCDEQLIGWIAMERLRQLRGFHHDPRKEMQKRHARFRKSAFYPKPDVSVVWRLPNTR